MRYLILTLNLAVATPSFSQSTKSDSVLQKISIEGMEKSQLYPLAQKLLDSIGPRLTGTAQQRKANDWAVAMYTSWGITSRAEQYGTWKDWRRGIAHFDLIAPRVRSLEGMLSTWSPGTKGTVEGPVVLFPKIESASDFEAALPTVRGKFVLFSFAWPSCRPDTSWKEFASPEAYGRMQKERTDMFNAWYTGRIRKSGLRGHELFKRFADAGALGILTVLVPPPGSQGWGVMKISSTIAENIPEVGLDCEDYGLVFRLAERNQGAVLRVNADAEFSDDVPVANVIAELRGSEKPNEYVMLSAHFDSWDPASGATDNGASSLVMMEAMRILKAVYPNPKRTIIAGHWMAEEQGFNGSRAFAADHPEIAKNIQIIFDADNGMGRVNSISADGFNGTAVFLRKWLSKLPKQLVDSIKLDDPGTFSRGIDAASFACGGAPAFSMSSVSWDYTNYTWHTNRDTFDKLVFDDLKSNAMLIAMLVYLASEDERVPREPAVSLPACGAPTRSWSPPR